MHRSLCANHRGRHARRSACGSSRSSYPAGSPRTPRFSRGYPYRATDARQVAGKLAVDKCLQADIPSVRLGISGVTAPLAASQRLRNITSGASLGRRLLRVPDLNLRNLSRTEPNVSLALHDTNHIGGSGGELLWPRRLRPGGTRTAPKTCWVRGLSS